MLSLTFLGSSAARPTVERNVSSLALEREGETLLFDCGEGTQRQMMRYGVSFALTEIFFTHFHADHFLGIVGLVRTLGLQGRAEPMRLYGPRGAKRILTSAISLGSDRIPFGVEIIEVEVGQEIGREPGAGSRSGYCIRAFATEHGPNTIGYALVEDERPGRFDPEKAKAAGVPEGPLWGKLQRGETVTVEGREIPAAGIVGEKRKGRKVVITGDTRPCAGTIEAAMGADLLVHEATFGEDEKERAKETNHSTAREAGQVALAAGVKKLVLTHLSARYSISAEELVKEAREVFPETVAARDGMAVEVPFAE